MEGTLGVPSVMLFAGHHGKQPCRAACESRVVGGDARASGRRPAGAQGGMQRMPGEGGCSSFLRVSKRLTAFRDPRRASATEGVRVTKVGVTNLSREQSLLWGARLGESREKLLIEGSSAGLASQEAARNRHRWQGASVRSQERGRPRDRKIQRDAERSTRSLRRCRAIARGESCRARGWITWEAASEGNLGGVHQGSGDHGRARGSHGLQAPVLAVPLQAVKAVVAKASEEALDTEARRSGLTKTSSFDEAAAAADLASFRASRRMV